MFEDIFKVNSDINRLPKLITDTEDRKYVLMAYTLSVISGLADIGELAINNPETSADFLDETSMTRLTDKLNVLRPKTVDGTPNKRITLKKTNDTIYKKR